MKKRQQKEKSKKTKDYSDEEDEDDYEGSSQEMFEKQKPKKRQKQVLAGGRRFIDDKAEESDDSDTGKGQKKGQHEMYDPEDLKRRTKNLDLTAFEKRAKENDEIAEKRRQDRQRGEQFDVDGSESDDYDDEVLSEGDVEMKQSLLPSTEDPRLWQVRVKKNHERIAVIALLNKSIDFQRRGTPLSILSATSSDTTEGYIYVEAFKEIGVREACNGLSFIFNKFMLVPTEEMPVIFENDKAKNCELREHQWVRIKSTGPYNGDIALVEFTSENKVMVRLIPRIDMTASNSKDRASRFQRIPQRLNYFPSEKGEGTRKYKHAELKKHVIQIKNQIFYKGFMFKFFPFKQIDSSPDIKPTHEELFNFQTLLKKTQLGTKTQNNESSDDEKFESVIKQALERGGTANYAKGDKISVNKGDLNGLKGIIEAIDDTQITFKAIGFEKTLPHSLTVDVSMVSKYFEPGDLVRIIEAKYKGDTGVVIEIEDGKASVMLDGSQQEIKISTTFLKLKSETDTNLVAALNVKQNGVKSTYLANDLVNFNGEKGRGLVLQVHEDYLRIIDQQGKLVNIKTSEIGKKIPAMKPGQSINSRDKNGQNLAVDQMVRIFDGPNKGLIAPIRHYDRNYIFLWHKQFVQSNGIFVESSRNVEILGREFVKKSSGQNQAIGSQNKMIQDQLVNKQVVIISGEFKGHRGRVVYADDKKARVELSTKCKIVPIDKVFVREVNPEENKPNNDGGRSQYGGGQSIYGGATVYDGGKTPNNPNTPSYYPQSQWGGGVNTNGKLQTAFNFLDGGQDTDGYATKRPGSAHHSNLLSDSRIKYEK